MASENKTGRRGFSAQPYGKTAPNPTRKKAGGERLLARIQNPREVALAEPAPAAIPTKRETGETDNHLQVRMRRFRENRRGPGKPGRPLPGGRNRAVALPERFYDWGSFPPRSRKRDQRIFTLDDAASRKPSCLAALDRGRGTRRKRHQTNCRRPPANAPTRTGKRAPRIFCGNFRACLPHRSGRNFWAEPPGSAVLRPASGGEPARRHPRSGRRGRVGIFDSACGYSALGRSLGKTLWAGNLPGDERRRAQTGGTVFGGKFRTGAAEPYRSEERRVGE